MPKFNTGTTLTIPDTKFTATTSEVAHGETLYWQYCGTCHAVNGGGGGLAPDLAFSPIAANNESFLSVVHKGAYEKLGMPNFGNRLSEKDILAIQKYILTKAKEGKK
jgi:quinohemoprotein ethanol dehydrogenase